MDIQSTLPATPPAVRSGAPSPALSSDFETFLQMLTAQARYQDPLEPIDSTEYAAQLAQFSMVEQQVQSNELLNALASQLGTGNMGQMAGWIGMEARTTAPVFFDGQPVTFYPNPAAVAEEANLVVYDAEGLQVDRRAIPVSTQPVSWAGVTADGTPFPPGLYRFEVESLNGDEVILTDPAESYARVTEARVEGDEAMVVLSGGVPVLASDVGALREPS